MFTKFARALTFDDVALVPQFNNIPSRTIPTLTTWLTKKTKTEVPIIPANMDTVISPELARVLVKNGGYPIFHRFAPLEEQKKWVEEFNENCYISSGTNKEDVDNAIELLKMGARGVCIDIAHGHSVMMIDTIKKFKAELPDKEVIAGNVCTAMGYQDLVNAGADAVKIGVGSGCFGSRTRILMSNGTYKNIEDIEAGDEIINKDGNPRKVLSKICTGKKNVIEITNGFAIKPTVVTADHRFWIGDLSSQSLSSIKQKSIAKELDKLAKTVPKSSKFKWKQIGDCDDEMNVLLIPKNIEWNLPDYFEIDMKQFSVRGKITEDKIINSGGYEINRFIKSGYDLGYIFGTYLGDGHARLGINPSNYTECGFTKWYFGKEEDEIVEKLSKCLENLLGQNPKIVKPLNKNITEVIIYNKNLTKLLFQFGKKTEKKLIAEYYCKDKQYIQGIYDGLIDSDGHSEKTKKGKIDTFTNTSIYLMELFGWCCLNLGISYAGMSCGKNAGGLKIIDESKLNESFRMKTHTFNRFSKDYLYTRIQNKKKVDEPQLTWDLEIDCPTHSFIADNVIVHNSCCTTRMVTGFGVPQLSAILECSEIAKKLRVPIICDGGVRGTNDVAKALGAGACTVMMGSMFSKTLESAGDKYIVPLSMNKKGFGINDTGLVKFLLEDKKDYSILDQIDRTIDNHGECKIIKKYRGQASKDFQDDFKGGLKRGTVPEGIHFMTEITSTAQELIDNYIGSLKSSMTYGGAKSIEEFQRKVTFVEISNNGLAENKPRPTQ